MAAPTRAEALGGHRTGRVLDATRGQIDVVTGDAMNVKMAAERRLADEVDAAQDRGDLTKAGGQSTSRIRILNDLQGGWP